MALIAAGWFIHDAIWHFLMVVYGMSGVVTLEFSLPDLETLDIHPDRTVLEATPQLQDGRWLFIKVTTAEDINDIEQLLVVKKRPKRN